MRVDERLEFQRHPYRFIAKRCRQIASDVSVTRLFLRKNTGRTEEAARRHRKAMFLSLTAPGRIQELADLFRQELRAELPQWQELDHVVLYETLQRVLTHAVCKWAGVPLASREAARRSKQLALFDAADRSPAHFKSRLARARTEDWAAGLIENVRLGALRPPLRTALREIALHRDIDGQLLSAQAAAVELLDLLRPAVAASGDIVNCARALHQFPKAVEPLKAGGQPYRDTFIGELRQRPPALAAVPARLAVALMRTALDFFTETIRYNVPEPDRHA